MTDDLEGQQLGLEVLTLDEERLVVAQRQPQGLADVEVHHPAAIGLDFDADGRLGDDLGRLLRERGAPDHGVRFRRAHPMRIAEVHDAAGAQEQNETEKPSLAPHPTSR